MKPWVIAITGPTASGKTAAAVAAAQALNGEILSMDSMQIYQGMDIGTAKPTEAERGGVAHHLLSYVPPDQPYSVSEYQRDARQCLHDVLSRGKMPIFCGGTGLYLQAVSHPLRFAQGGVEESLRARLFAQAETPEGVLALHARLAQVDPQTAARLHPNDMRRVIRALEVYETTGIPMSQRITDWEEDAAENWLIFAIEWLRPELNRRIDLRVDEMMRQGLVREVRALLAGGLSPAAQSMQAIGYKELTGAIAGESPLEEAVALVKQRTHQYAKRQMTWLRRDARVQWLRAEEYPDAAALQTCLIQKIREAIGAPGV